MVTSRETAAATATAVQCHYDVLGVPQQADAATIKKAHRKLALKWHPDKHSTGGDDEAATEQFRLVQQAYECLSDAAERKWYDDHRDAILKGWSAGSASGNGGDASDMLFDVEPFIFAGCYRGFGDDEHGFFCVYKAVFFKLYQEEELGAAKDGSNASSSSSSVIHLATDFGTSTSSWQDVAAFYNAWETFSSSLNFCWADPFDFDALQNDAPNRRVRRAMEEENRKARKAAKRARNDEIAMLVRFVKKRDVRVVQRQAEMELERIAKLQQQKLELEQRKKDTAQARESWRVQAEQEMVQAEEEDRLAGRLRLADLEDDYDYGGKKGKKKKSKKKKNKDEKKDDGGEDDKDENDDGDSIDEGKETLPTEGEHNIEGDENGEEVSTSVVDKGGAENGIDTSNDQKDDDADPLSDNDSSSSSSSNSSSIAESDNQVPAAAVDEAESEQEVEEEESSKEEEEDEPDFWHCECCRKEFKSEGQMQNHMKSKKHKEAFKRFEKKLAELQQQEMTEVVDE